MQFKLLAKNQFERFDRPYIPVWVNTQIFEEWWSKDLDYFAPDYHTELNSSYFARIDRDPSFCIGRGSLSVKCGVDCFYFSGGRHRTRWIISLGVDPLPVAILPSAVERAREIGLLIRFIEAGESVELPVTIEEIEQEAAEFEQYLMS